MPRMYLEANSSARENAGTARSLLGLSPEEEAQRSEVALHPVNDFLLQIYQVGDLGFFPFKCRLQPGDFNSLFVTQIVTSLCY